MKRDVINVFEKETKELIGELNVNWDVIKENLAKDAVKANELGNLLGHMLKDVETIVPSEREDSKVKALNRASLKVMIEELSKRPDILEKIVKRFHNHITDINSDRAIFQSVLHRHMFTGYGSEKENRAISLKTSAQILYLLSRAEVLTMFKKVSADKRKYFTLGMGEKYPSKDVELKRIVKKLNKKKRRLVQHIPFEGKVGRSNSKGLYDFKTDVIPNALKAIETLRKNGMRLVIPEHVSIEYIVENIFKLSLDNPNQAALYEEVYNELEMMNGKVFFSDKSLDRILRIYGFKWLDITSSKEFRPFLRMPRKRKVTERGAFWYDVYYIENHNKWPEWYANEVSNISVGDYTDIMVEVDANNQGPALIAGYLMSRSSFNMYWSSSNAPKMYEVFRKKLLQNLGLPSNVLEDIDVKYKIMTVGYNKSTRSNVLGGNDFIEKLEQEYMPGMTLSNIDFHSWPLKLQLKKRLTANAVMKRIIDAKYTFKFSALRPQEYNVFSGNLKTFRYSDKYLIEMFDRTVFEVAPFLKLFQDMMMEFQNDVIIKPSVWKWRAEDGDEVQCARTMVDIEDVKFLDLTGAEHTVQYQFNTLIPQNERGGETALSPTKVASSDAYIARHLIAEAPHWIQTNHDAYFVHGNDVDWVIERYKELYWDTVEYAQTWLQSMAMTYGARRFKSFNSFYEIFNIDENDMLTKADVLASNNLVGV